jgi:hypothetical protein
MMTTTLDRSASVALGKRSTKLLADDVKDACPADPVLASQWAYRRPVACAASIAWRCCSFVFGLRPSTLPWAFARSGPEWITARCGQRRPDLASGGMAGPRARPDLAREWCEQVLFEVSGDDNMTAALR